MDSCLLNNRYLGKFIKVVVSAEKHYSVLNCKGGYPQIIVGIGFPEYEAV